MKDAFSKGRGKIPKVNDNTNRAKLTAEQVKEIRALFLTTPKLTCKVVADKYGIVREGAIRSIRINESWKHLLL